jgi:hypothetical protein
MAPADHLGRISTLHKSQNKDGRECSVDINWSVSHRHTERADALGAGKEQQQDQHQFRNSSDHSRINVGDETGRGASIEFRRRPQLPQHQTDDETRRGDQQRRERTTRQLVAKAGLAEFQNAGEHAHRPKIQWPPV